MQYVVLVITIVITSIFTSLLPKLYRLNAEKYKESNVIKQPGLYAAVGIILPIALALMMGVAAILGPESFQDEENIMILLTSGIPVAIIIFTLCIFFMLFGFNWQIEIYDDRFVYRNLRRKTKEFLYSDIIIRTLSACIRVYHKPENCGKNQLKETPLKRRIYYIDNKSGGKIKGKHIVGISFMQNYELLQKKYKSYNSKQKKGNDKSMVTNLDETIGE